LARNIGKTTHK